MKSLTELGMEHVGFLVPDLEEAVNRFQTVYGIDDFVMYDFQPLRAWSYGEEVENYRLKIAMANINHQSSGIELIQHVSGKGVHQDWIADGNQGMHHIAFKVDDYEYYRKHFLENGAKFLFESETEDDRIGYRRCFYAEDAKAGMVYEIKEMAYFRNK